MHFCTLFQRRASCGSRSQSGLLPLPAARRAHLDARGTVRQIPTRPPFASSPDALRPFLPLPCHGRGEGHGARPQSSMSSVLRLPPTRGVLIRSCFATAHAPLRSLPPAQARRKGRASCPSPRPLQESLPEIAACGGLLVLSSPLFGASARRITRHFSSPTGAKCQRMLPPHRITARP